LTRKHRLILRPLEKLQVQRVGSIDVAPVEIDDYLDLQFKAGLYKQVDAFLNGHPAGLCTIAEQAKNAALCEKIANYSPSSPSSAVAGA
jgi:hypothetical protein